MKTEDISTISVTGLRLAASAISGIAADVETSDIYRFIEALGRLDVPEIKTYQQTLQVGDVVWRSFYLAGSGAIPIVENFSRSEENRDYVVKATFNEIGEWLAVSSGAGMVCFVSNDGYEGVPDDWTHIEVDAVHAKHAQAHFVCGDWDDLLDMQERVYPDADLIDESYPDDEAD